MATADSEASCNQIPQISVETDQIDVAFAVEGEVKTNGKIMEGPSNDGVSCCATLEQASVTAVKDMRSLWDQIGLSPKEQEDRIAKMHAAMLHCLHSAVEQARETHLSLNNEIAAQNERISTLRAELSMPEEMALDSSNLDSLQTQAAALKEKADALSKIKQSWVQRIRQQQAALEALYLVLDKAVPDQLAQIGALTEERITDFVEEIRVAESEVANRKVSVSKLVKEICSFWEELEIAPATELERCIVRYDPQSSSKPLGLSLSMDVIEALSASAAELAERKAGRLEEVRSLGAEITKLWTQLGIPATEQEAFKNGQRGIGLATVKACEKELIRLREIKEARLSGLIAEQRDTVHLLHERVHAGPLEKQKYDHICSTCTEESNELFNALDAYTAELRKKQTSLQPLLESVHKWQKLVRERQQYEELVTDPTRLLSRQSGNSLREELEMERRVKKILPILTKKLKKRIGAWEQTEDELWVDGTRFLDHMDTVGSEYSKKCATKKAKKKASKQKKLNNDLRYGTTPRTPFSGRKSMAYRSRTPLKNSAAKSRSRWTVGGASSSNVCALRQSNKEN